MPSLRDYRDRISSVKSTKKITSAMKMVAASKLRRAQEKAEASQPYARAMAAMLARVAAGVPDGAELPPLLTGTGREDVHLLIVVTSDRGLCGGFNTNLLRRVRQEIVRLEQEGRTVKLICAGRKARDLLGRNMPDRLAGTYTELGGRTTVSFAEADQIAALVLEMFETGQFDVCTIMYNEFRNVLSQPPASQQLIPFSIESAGESEGEDSAATAGGVLQPYHFEPEEEVILGRLLPRNLAVQIYRALLDSAAGEQAARMTAMDNATRNAGDMIADLSLKYNRARQAYITKELIEIISGAEAL